MKEALAAPDDSAELSAEQIDYLLDKLAVMADAGTQQTSVEMFTPAGFEAASFEDVFAAVQAGAVS